MISGSSFRYAFISFSLWMIALVPRSATALPMYAMRSGRTCANCHISPTAQDPQGWLDPKLAERKCSMSCVACHVNPSGGGLRNAAGRYYGQSTLSIIATQQRSYSDHGRNLVPQSWKKRSPARGIPSDFKAVKKGVGADTPGRFSTWGRPWRADKKPSVYALWDGRYADLNADPLVAVGMDLRGAYWTGTSAFFPMQTDFHLSVHPIEHLTVMGTLSGRGRSGGLKSTIGQERFPIFARNAFIMVHELPYMIYGKAGIFLPNFGTHLDDHTSFIRDYFEMDVSRSEDTVIGFEVGLSPNYPFATLSVFQNSPTFSADDSIFPGFGAAINFGWRDLGWSLSAHGIIKRRDLAAGGNLDGAGVAWGLNPFYFSNVIPITYMGEVSVGRRQRLSSGRQVIVLAIYHELWFTIANGVSIRTKYDFGSRDIKVVDDNEHRLSATLDLGIYPGVTLLVTPRVLLSARESSAMDVLVHTHFWF